MKSYSEAGIRQLSVTVVSHFVTADFVQRSS